MLDEYEINSGTLAIVPINNELTQIYEQEEQYFIKKNSNKIVDDSCKFFGSSYLGRHEGTKKLVGFKYKTPIIISETQEIIFFPTTSPKLKNCFWISLNNLENYEKNNQKVAIYFKNSKKIDLDISYFTLENQIYRATMLSAKLKKIKQEAK